MIRLHKLQKLHQWRMNQNKFIRIMFNNKVLNSRWCNKRINRNKLFNTIKFLKMHRLTCCQKCTSFSKFYVLKWLKCKTCSKLNYKKWNKRTKKCLLTWSWNSKNKLKISCHLTWPKTWNLPIQLSQIVQTVAEKC